MAKNYIEYSLAWWFCYLYLPVMILRARLAKLRGIDVDKWIEDNNSEVTWMVEKAVKVKS